MRWAMAVFLQAPVQDLMMIVVFVSEVSMADEGLVKGDLFDVV